MDKKVKKGNLSAPMPTYKSKDKVVHAFKIKEIVFDADLAKKENRKTDGRATITPAEEGFASFKVSAEYVQEQNPEVGGYYFVDEFGYQSWSPAKEFESEYTRRK